MAHTLVRTMPTKHIFCATCANKVLCTSTCFVILQTMFCPIEFCSSTSTGQSPARFILKRPIRRPAGWFTFRMSSQIPNTPRHGVGAVQGGRVRAGLSRGADQSCLHCLPSRVSSLTRSLLDSRTVPRAGPKRAFLLFTAPAVVVEWSPGRVDTICNDDHRGPACLRRLFFSFQLIQTRPSGLVLNFDGLTILS